jgi:hypothetical protein
MWTVTLDDLKVSSSTAVRNSCAKTRCSVQTIAPVTKHEHEDADRTHDPLEVNAHLAACLHDHFSFWCEAGQEALLKEGHLLRGQPKVAVRLKVLPAGCGK